MATYNITVSTAIIQNNSYFPSSTDNRLYLVDGKLFFGGKAINLANYENTDIELNTFSSETDLSDNPNEGNISSFILSRSTNDTLNAHTSVSKGCDLGSIFFKGSDGSSFINAAKINAISDIRDGDNSLGYPLISQDYHMPGALRFSVVESSGQEPSEALRISRERYVSIGYQGSTYSDNNKLLVQDSSIKIKTNSSNQNNYNKLNFDKTKSNLPGEHAALITGQKVGCLDFCASDGTNYIPLTQIHGETTKDISNNSASGKIVFSVSKDTNTPTEQLFIDDNFNVVNNTILTTLIGDNTKITNNLNLDKTLSVSGISSFSGKVNISNHLCVSKTIFALANPGIKTNYLLINENLGYISLGEELPQSLSNHGFGIRTNSSYKIEIKTGSRSSYDGNHWKGGDKILAPGGVKAVTHTSNGNIAIFTGEDNNLTGNNNLKFDGTNLNVKGSVNIHNNLNIGNFLSVSDLALISSSLNVNKNLNTKNLKVLGTLSVKGETNIVNNIFIGGNANVKKTLSVNSGIYNKGLLSVKGNFIFTKDISLAKSDSELVVSGTANINDGINVFGHTNLDGKLSINGKVNFADNIFIGGNLISSSNVKSATGCLAGALTVDPSSTTLDKVYLSSNLSVKEAITSSGNISISSTATINSFTRGGSLSVVNNAIISGTSSLLGSNIIKNRLSVKGNTFLNNLTSKDTIIHDSLRVGGRVCILKNLNISGNTNITGSLSINSLINFNNNIKVFGCSNIAGNLSVGDNSYLSNVNINGNLSVIGSMCISAGLNITKTLVANNNIQVKDYINFGYQKQSNGIGLRLNSGRIQFKNSGGNWGEINSGGGGGIDLNSISGNIQNRIPVFDSSNTLRGYSNLFFKNGELHTSNVNASNHLCIGRNLSVGDSSLGSNITFGPSAKSLGSSTSTYTSSSNVIIASGYNATSSGDYSSSFGLRTKSESLGQMTIGLYPEGFTSSSSTYVSTDPLFVVGSGTATVSEKNIFIMRKNADALLKGNLNISKSLNISSNINISGKLSVNKGVFSVVNILNQLRMSDSIKKNTNIGVDALKNNNSGNYNNTTLGYKAGFNVQCGSYNVYIGSLSGGDNSQTKTCGSFNVCIGNESGGSVLNGNKNILIGYKAGNNIIDGSNNIVIGSDSKPSSSQSKNEIIIGDTITGHGDNIAVIGNSDFTGWYPKVSNQVDLGSSAYNFKNIYSNRIITVSENAPWKQLGENTTPYGVDGEAFTNISLSYDGNTLAVGDAIYDSSSNDNKGRVRIYRYINNNWIQLDSDIVGTSAGDKLGRSVSLSSNGNIVAIGEQEYGSGGRARVFKYNGTSWIGLGGDNDMLGDSGGQAGQSISINSDGTIVAVGDDNYESGKGRVKVYKYNGSNWILLGNETDIVGTGVDDTGEYVSLNKLGNILAVGEPKYNSNAGRVRVFKYNGSSWIAFGNDIIGNVGDKTGVSVSLSSNGKILAVGEDEYNVKAGRVRVFEYNNNSWNILGGNTDIVGISGDGGEYTGLRTGYSVSLNGDGNIVIVGETDYDIIFQGRVRIFKYNYSSNKWNIIKTFTGFENPISFDNYYSIGRYVAYSRDNNIIAIGPGNNGYRRRTKVYKLDNLTNVRIGENSGNKIGENPKGVYNTIIGSNSDVSKACGSNQIVIGYNVTGSGNNTMTLGNTYLTDVYLGQCSMASLHCNQIFAKGNMNISNNLNIGGSLNVRGTLHANNILVKPSLEEIPYGFGSSLKIRLRLDSDANDSSGNENNFTVTGSTDNEFGPELVDGRTGWRFDEDNNEYLRRSIDFSELIGNTFTLMFWIRTTSPIKYGSYGAIPMLHPEFQLYFSYDTSTSTNSFNLNLGNGSLSITNLDSFLNAGGPDVWNHFAFVVDGSAGWGYETENIKIYINSVKIYDDHMSSSGVNNIVGSGNLDIGYFSSTSFDGFISDFRIYNELVSATNISSIYNGTTQKYSKNIYFDNIDRISTKISNSIPYSLLVKHSNNTFEEVELGINKNRGLTVVGSTNLNGTLSVSGTTTLTGNLDIGSSVNAKGALSVGGIASFNNLSLLGTSSFNDLSVQGTVNIGNGLNVSGATNLTGTLSVSGDAFLSNVNVISNLSVAGNVIIDGKLNIGGTIYANNNLVVQSSGEITIGNTGIRDNSGELQFKQDGSWFQISTQNLNNGLNVSGTTCLGGRLSVSGKTNLDSSLHVVGNVNVKTSLSVKDETYLYHTNIGGTLQVNTNNTKVSIGSGHTSIAGGSKSSWNLLQISNFYKNELFIELIGLSVESGMYEIIGNSSGGAAFFGQITYQYFGNVKAMSVLCLEVPAGVGSYSARLVPWSAEESNLTYGQLISDDSTTEQILMDKAGDWTAGEIFWATSMPSNNYYIYLANKSSGSGTYTAGKYLLTLYGYA